MKMLIEKGADPCVKNRNGKSPFEVATAPAVYNFLIQSRGKSYFFLLFWNFILYLCGKYGIFIHGLQGSLLASFT